MRVHQVGVARCAPGRAREAPEHQGERQGEVRTGTQVPGHPIPVGDAVVPEACRRHDLDLDSSLSDPLDLIGDEEARDVTRVARVGRGEDCDLQALSLRAKTIGVASASSARA